MIGDNGVILIYQTEDGMTKVEVTVQDETVWLSQQQMAELYQTSRTNVVEHIKHIYAEGELDKLSTCQNFRQVRQEGSRQVTREIPYYNLDMIISLGYRIKSVIATRFRIWATERLKEYMIKGFAMDDERLKGNGGGNYWKELLDRIRDIRSSEKVLYRQVLDLYATSVDYNPHSEESIRFFKNMSDYVEQLDAVLSSGNRKLLSGAGRVSHIQALKRAKEEYQKYQVSITSPVEDAYLKTIKTINNTAKQASRH